MPRYGLYRGLFMFLCLFVIAVAIYNAVHQSSPEREHKVIQVEVPPSATPPHVEEKRVTHPPTHVSPSVNVERGPEFAAKDKAKAAKTFSGPKSAIKGKKKPVAA